MRGLLNAGRETVAPGGHAFTRTWIYSAAAPAARPLARRAEEALFIGRE